MKVKERDELLIKMAGDIGGLKEGVHNTYRLTEKLERHNAEQNGRIRRNSRFIYLIIGALSASSISFGAVSWFG